ncbi:MAG TPA: hypothetical protein VGG39_11670 [Polyangiaceae bacterium]|jgi:hypothetical protein
MRSSILGSCLAVALSLVVAGCASHAQVAASAPPSAPARAGSTNMQASEPTMQDQGWAALVEADRAMDRLREDRDARPDPGRVQAIDAQLYLLRARSDRLMDDMTIDDGRVHDRAIRADVASLNVVTGRASTEMQRDSTQP